LGAQARDLLRCANGNTIPVLEKYIQPLSYVQNASTQYLGRREKKLARPFGIIPVPQKMKVTSIFLLLEKRQEFNA
jgi:hypothetical protein